MDERQNLDDQKGPKTPATPAGVNRRDMAESGPDMARTAPGGGADHQPAIEHDQTAAFGEPGEVATPDRDATPVPGEDPGDTAC
ncbi:MAG: hypothetical protein AB1679_15810 [Actinomycetota bacterium]|jgi:hypothetical protein